MANKKRQGTLGDRLDRAIAVLFPAAAVRRQVARLAYDAASRSSIRRRYVTSIGGSADAHATPSDLFRLINMSRNFERNNPVVAGQYVTMANNIAGTTLRVQSRAGQGPGQPKDEWKAFRAEQEHAWTEWATSPKACDVQGRRSFHAMVHASVQTLCRDGDMLFLKVNQGDGALLAFEADQCATPLKDRSAGNVSYGIRVDSSGRAAAYHLSDAHSSSGYETPGGNGAWYPAKYVLHPAHRRRFSQTRGSPILVASFTMIQDMQEALEAYILGTKLAASVGLVFLQQGGPAWGKARSTVQEDGAGNDRREEKVHPAMIFHGEPGEEVKTIDMNRPTPDFAEFFNSMWRWAGRPTAMAGELILLDFSQSNFSNTRQAIIETRHGFTVMRNDVVIPQIVRPTYRWKMGWWCRPGGPLGMRAKGLPPDFLAHEVSFSGWDWIDKLKDLKADGEAVDRGFVAPQTVSAQRGYDLEEVLVSKGEAIKIAQEVAQRLGLEDWRVLLPNGLLRKTTGPAPGGG